MELSKLRENYPEFANYLLESQADLTSTTQSPSKHQTTSSIRTRYIPSTSSAPKLTNGFLYFNNRTNAFEGVSMQSTYSFIKLKSNKNITLITTTTQILPSKSTTNIIGHLSSNIKIATPVPTSSTSSSTSKQNKILFLPSLLTRPLKQMISSTTPTVTTPTRLNNEINYSVMLPFYHQFIYTFKLSSRVAFRDNKDLVDILNEQSVDSSKVRVNLIRRICEQLKINGNNVKFNWVERLNKSSTSVQSSNEFTSSEVNDESYNLDNDYESYDESSEPQFVSENQPTTAQIEQPSNKPYYILVSFSNAYLLEMQKNYFSMIKSSLGTKMRLNELKLKYENECENFFRSLKEKHENKFYLNMFNLTSSFILNNKNEKLDKYERLKKVQFLKLCDLDKISSILSIKPSNDTYSNNFFIDSINLNKYASLDNQFKEMANFYIKNSTQEVLFTRKYDDFDDSYSHEEEEALSTSNKQDLSQLVKFKSRISSNETIFNSTDAYIAMTNETTNATEDTDRFFFNLLSKKELKDLFWSVVPEEDLVLAVIVPLTIIVSMCTLTIVVACLLHMCNKNYRKKTKATKLASNTNNTTETNATVHTNTIDKSTYGKSNPLYKQKAYLSKGVPVILYEEMSDKPIEDLDENNRDIFDSGTGRRSVYSNYYRSPLILRNEKPPTPAPPEYNRQSYHPKNDHDILNELQKMLHGDLPSNLDSPDESAALISKKSSSQEYKLSSASPSSTSSPASPHSTDDNQQLLYQPPQPIKTYTSSSIVKTKDVKFSKTCTQTTNQNGSANQQQSLNKLLP